MRYTSELSKEGIIFSDRPNSVPYNYRICYKVAVICLIMSETCGKRGCSLTKLHILSGTIMNQSIYDKVISLLSGKRADGLCIRFDPAVNRAIEYAISDEIIYQQANGLYRLSDKGKQLSKLICKDQQLMIKEKEVVHKISTDLSEEIIQRISDNWGKTDD